MSEENVEAYRRGIEERVRTTLAGTQPLDDQETAMPDNPTELKIENLEDLGGMLKRPACSSERSASPPQRG